MTILRMPKEKVDGIERHVVHAFLLPMIRAQTSKLTGASIYTLTMLLNKQYCLLADEDRIGSSRNKLKILKMTAIERRLVHDSRF